jgi:hypothetical protein
MTVATASAPCGRRPNLGSCAAIIRNILEISLNETLVAMCQMFLVPASILFAAVGVANTRFVKLLVCLLGVAVTGLWLYRIWFWTGLSLVDRRTGLGIAGMFGFCWVATLLHQLKSMASGGGYER